MKKVFVLLLVSLLVLACGEKVDTASTKGHAEQAKNYVEVIYFHSKQRCMTCRSIERNTNELLKANFARQMKAGKVVYRVIDISKRENARMAEKYKVTWSSLFLVRHKDGKEKAENLTEYAFAHSRRQPEVFKAGVTQKIKTALK